MSDQLAETEMPVLKFVQAAFSAGLNQDWSDVFVEDGAYPLCINCDNRAGGLQPVRGMAEQTGFPAGKLQGIYGFNNYLVLFVAGKMYVRHYTSDVWSRVFPLQLSTTADRIYVQAVPASTFNYDRKLINANDNTSVNQLALSVGGTNAGLIVQDGINQPWLVKPTLQAVITQKYKQWSRDGRREYVPVGKQMVYNNGILFIISADGSQIYRSVTGRPLDFMVNIDTDGDAGGDAATVSYAVSDETINSISVLPSNQLLVGTENNCYGIILDRTQTIFGEPTFVKSYTLSSGIVNQFATFELLGDTGFIDYDGLRSFNAVSQDNTEARSNIFSRRIRKLIESLQQDPLYVCACSANGLIHVHLKTIRGYGILTYDIENKRWISFNQFDTVQFKQLTVFRANRMPQIFGITDTDQVFELYAASADFADATVYSRATTAKLERNYEALLGFIEVTIDNLDRDGTVTVTPIIDGVEKKEYFRKVKIKRKALPWSAAFPVKWPVSSLVSNLTVPFQGRVQAGWKVAAKVEWDCGGQLSRIGIHGNVDRQAVGVAQSGESH